MLGVIKRMNGGIHDTNIQLCEHTGKKFQKNKIFTVLCVCVSARSRILEI